MKKLISILIILCFAFPVNAGISDMDITTILPESFAQGGSKFLELIGDQLYKMAGVENTTQAQTAITNFMVERQDFIGSEGVQKTKDMNAFWYLVVFVGFIFFGAARIAMEKGRIANGFTAQESYSGKYLKFIFMGLIFYLFYLYGLQWIIDLEWLMAKGFVVQSANILPMTPQNGISYLLIAIASVIIWLFMVIRYIIVYIVVMYILWLICFSRVPLVGLIAWGVLIYGAFLFCFRIIIAFLFMAGATAIESAHIGGLVLPYLGLLIGIIYVCYWCMILPIFLIYRKAAGSGDRRSPTPQVHHHYGSNGSSSYKNEEILHE